MISNSIISNPIISKSNFDSPRVAVSSWALHRVLGAPQFYGAESENIPVASHHRGASTLLELPQQLASRGLQEMEICHFHLPSRDAKYLSELQSELARSGVQLHALLIDDGDITHPENSARDAAWIENWIPVARELGAKNLRVIAGQSTHADALEQSARVLKNLAARAKESDSQDNEIQVTIENWYDLLSSPQNVLWLLDETEGRVGLNLDFGNWSGAQKYEDLSAIAPRASSCHAKAEYSQNNQIEAEDFARCLAVMRDANFCGPFTLVSSGAGEDDWQGVETAREFISNFFEEKS